MSIRIDTPIIMFTSKKYHPIYVEKDSLEELPQSFFLSGHTIAYLYTIGKYPFYHKQMVHKLPCVPTAKGRPQAAFWQTERNTLSVSYVSFMQARHYTGCTLFALSICALSIPACRSRRFLKKSSATFGNCA